MENLAVNNKLDELFCEWKNIQPTKKNMADENYSSDFMEDGVMRNGHENEWDSSKHRIMFVLKECSEHGGDVRDWLKREDNQRLERIRHEGHTSTNRNVFLPLAYILYGIFHDLPEFSKIPPMADYYHTKVPFAYVEAKKIPGGGTAHNNEIKTYVENFNDFIQREIEILNPTLIICFDNGECELEKTLAQMTDAPVITTNHPSAFTKSPEQIYNKAIENYKRKISFRLLFERVSNGMDILFYGKPMSNAYCGVQLRKEGWEKVQIGFEFIQKNMRGFVYGIKYCDENSPLNESIKEQIEKNRDIERSSSWWPWFKRFEFDGKDYTDFNKEDVIRDLYDGTMEKTINKLIDELIDEVEEYNK